MKNDKRHKILAVDDDLGSKLLEAPIASMDLDLELQVKVKKACLLLVMLHLMLFARHQMPKLMELSLS